MLTQPAPDCPGDGGLCPWLWEVTGQRWLAENSHLALVPLRILMIVVAAVALRWPLHRAVARLVRRSASGEAPVLLRPLPERVRDTVRQAAALRPDWRRVRAEAIGSVLRGAITVTVFAVATLLVLSELGLALAPLLAGAGIVGVALGFGAQSLVRALLAGVFMLLEDQYGVGDSVDLGEVRGIVEAVGLRITTAGTCAGWSGTSPTARSVGSATAARARGRGRGHAGRVRLRAHGGGGAAAWRAAPGRRPRRPRRAAGAAAGAGRQPGHDGERGGPDHRHHHTGQPGAGRPGAAASTERRTATDRQ